ncbi:MAG: hypothetical protein ABIP93_11270 [Gemmatimonadaceae bacterium]
MSHLPTDRLAALGDEEPTPAEAAHLVSCAECSRERTAYDTLVAMARLERNTIALPLTRWDSIARALTAEQTPAPTRILALEQPPSRSVTRRVARFPLQAAAGLLLVAGGMIAGRASVGEGLLPVSPTADASSPAASDAAAVNASMTGTGSTTFASIEEARQAQMRSEAIYQQAAAFLAQHDTTGAGDGSPVVYRSRLAALDQMGFTLREAMRQAPHDPVINGYYLTTLGQREATIRQLNTVLPASLRTNSF